MTCKTLATLTFTTASLLFNAQADITTGLQGYWTFNDSPGSSVAGDSGPNGYTGTLTGFSDSSYTSMWTAGRFGGALLFNTNSDTGDYVSVPDATGLDFGSTKAFTLAAWVYCSVAGGSQSNGACIIDKGFAGQEQYSLTVSNGVFQCSTRNSSGKSGQVVNSTVSPSAGVWYHVVGIWSASPQQHFIYIDGAYNNTYSGSGFLTSAYSTNHPLSIGCRESSAISGYNVPFQGIIDDVHIYNRALTASDIYQLYTNGATSANAPAIATQPRGVSCYLGDSPVFAVTVNSSVSLLPVGYQWRFDSTNIAGATTSAFVVTNAQATNAGTYSVVITNVEGTNFSSNAVLTLQSLPAPNTNGLVGYWKFDDASGSSTAADSSGYANNSTLGGFTDTTFTTMWTNGVIGSALAFNGDGTGSNVVAVPGVGAPAPAVLDFSTNPAFTLSAWVNGGTTQTNGGAIIAKGAGGGGEQYVLDINGGYYRFFVRDTNGTLFTAQTTVAPNGLWQLVTAVLNASSGIMNCYVNGTLAAEAVAPFSLQTNSHEVSIGNRQPATGNYGDAFTGTLDDVHVFNRDLTSADVSALYAAKPAPLVVTWQSTSLDVVAKANAQLAPTLSGGILPYTYQWQQNGSNIPGATKYPLLLSNAASTNAGSFDLILSDRNIVPAVTSSVVSVTIVTNLTFNSNGVTWMSQGSTASAIWPGTNIALLTPLANNQSNSVFYDFPLNVGQFQASFTYQVTQTPVGATGPGDGVVFCVQNDPRGPSALGYAGNGLGVGNIPNVSANLAISPSVELELNINSTAASAIGVSWNTNGALGPVISSSPVILNNKDAINVSITYQDGVATVILTDTNNNTAFSTSTNVDITSILGSAAGYVGFTASTASGYAAQQVSDFTFQSLVAAPPSIVTPPQSILNLPASQTAVFSVTAMGSHPIGYQWQLNGTNLANGLSFTGSGATVSGSTTANLTVANVRTADNGTYSVLITNGFLPNASANAVLTVNNLPQVEAQTSTNIEVFAGSNPNLVMSVAGLAPFQFQWTSNGNVIVGATNSSYMVLTAQGSTTTYGCTVTNAFGTNFLNPITLTVLPAPTNPYPVAVLASHPMDYWRLDETSGTVGYDYTSGNNGVYSNTVLNSTGYTSGFNPQSDSTETSAFFGNFGTNNNYMGMVPSFVNFASPTNTSAEFSVEAWIHPSGGLVSGAGIVSVGYGGGGEQFCMDIYTATNYLRFFVRNAGGTAYYAQSSFVPANDGMWHHVVGVCDQAGGHIYLYADGQLIASNTLPAGSGLLASTNSLTIGSRQEGLGTQFDDQFAGMIDDVSLYNYALSSTNVLTHYYAAGIAPANLQVLPTSLTTNQNNNATFTAMVTGTPPLSYFWYDTYNGNNLLSTNAVLTVTNVQSADAYQVVVSNVYGTVNTIATLNVNSGPVYIVTQPSPLLVVVPPGYPLSITVGVGGTAPFKFQWYMNSSTPIPGATNAIYSFLSSVGTNTYTLWVTNQSSGTQTASSSPVTVQVSAMPPVIGFGDGTSWQANGGASFIGSPAVLELTDGNPSEARTAFYNTPQYIYGFLASFTYTPSAGGTSTRADGATFTLQNSPNGLYAAGGAGGQLGYYGIAPSVAFEIDIDQTGINWETNGFTAGQGGLPNGATGSVNINSLDPINVTLYYSSSTGQLEVELVDNTTLASYVTNYTVGDLGALLGSDFAYVGFTGGTGASDSVQKISNFAYSYSQIPSLAIGPGASGKVVISWSAPTVSTNFVLQQSSVVSGPWSNVVTSPTVVSNLEQVAVSPAGSAQFYRLVLPNP